MKRIDQRIRTVGGAAGLFALFALLAGGALAAQDGRRLAEPGRPPREFWLFFSPEASRLAGDVERLGAALRSRPDVVVRPVLLSSDLVTLRKPSKDLGEAIKALRTLQGEAFGLQVLDQDGLARAKELGIGQLPAFAVIEPPDARGMRGTRIACGYGVKFEELLR